MKTPTRSQSGRTALVAAAAIAFGVGAALSTTSAIATDGAVSLAGSNFEIDTDANLEVDHSAPPSIDWASVTEVRREDSPSGKNDESFGQGTKEDTAEPTVVSGSIPPNKSDLKWFGLYQEGTTTSGFLNLFWSRVQDPVGTTNMDFELNKRQCTVGQSPADPDCSSNGITPLRSPGDLLITYDLAKGGTVPIISMRAWQAGGFWGGATDLSQTNDAAGSINDTEIPAIEADGLGAHSARTFGEAQIDLSVIFTAPDCLTFGSAYLKSRASDSFTAALKDFVPPAPVNLTNCVTPSISTAQSFVPNDSATVTVASGLGDLEGTIRFRLYDNATCAGTTPVTGLLYDGSFNIATGAGTGLSRTVATDNTTAVTASKSLYWLVEFDSTNSGHNDVTSACGVEASSLIIDNDTTSP
jgi:hypothetical protein